MGIVFGLDLRTITSDCEQVADCGCNFGYYGEGDACKASARRGGGGGGGGGGAAAVLLLLVTLLP